MKLTALQLCVIQDTLTHSLNFRDFGSHFTDKSRENVRDAIAQIMSEIKLEIITDKAEFTVDADAGI